VNRWAGGVPSYLGFELLVSLPMVIAASGYSRAWAERRERRDGAGLASLPRSVLYGIIALIVMAIGIGWVDAPDAAGSDSGPSSPSIGLNLAPVAGPRRGAAARAGSTPGSGLCHRC
jgi:hypothetical protein